MAIMVMCRVQTGKMPTAIPAIRRMQIAVALMVIPATRRMRIAQMAISRRNIAPIPTMVTASDVEHGLTQTEKPVL